MNKIDLRGIKSMQRQLSRSGSGLGPVVAMKKRWGRRYLAAVKRRYVRNSRGGGEWVKLAESTKRRRGATGRALILRDTGLLLGGLDAGGPGNLLRFTRSGIEVGFGGPAKHPGTRGITVAELALIHDQGDPKANIPARPILIRDNRDMPKETLTGMASDLKAATKQVLEIAARKIR